MTTGDFTSAELLAHENNSALDVITEKVALAIGEKASSLATERAYPITISIRLDGAEIFRRALPGADSEQISWIERKANVVALTHHSTMYERVLAEESGTDWHNDHGVEDATHAIHGGGFPLKTKSGEYKGILLISGLPQVQDHLFAVEVLSHFS